MTSTQRRVSCAGLCRIRNTQGDYLLSINSGQLEKKQLLLTPIGGVLKYASQTLLDRFEATSESKLDLRLFIPQEKLDAFCAWFAERHAQEREISPFRELHEELVEELKVLPSLSENQVKIQYQYLRVTERLSNRHNATGILTINLAEVFDVIFLEHVHIHVLDNISPASQLYWVTEEEIVKGKNAHNIKVAASNLIEVNIP